VVVVVWAAASRALGYGVAGSGEYFDPIRSPVAYLSALPGRATARLFSELSGHPADWWNAYDEVSATFPYVFLATAWFCLSLFTWLIAPLLRRSASARFWTVGMLLALMPAASAFPADRLLSWVSVGGAGLIAELFAASVEDAGPRGWLARVTALGVLVFHGVLAVLQLPVRSAAITTVRDLFERVEDAIPRDPSVTDRTVVYVNPPSDAFVTFVPTTRAALGIPRPKTQRWLATGESRLTIRRVDERTLSVAAAEGFVHRQPERMFRGAEPPFRVGQKIVLDGLDVTVTQVTGRGRPLAVEFDFAEPLSSSRYLWLVWRGDRFHPYEVPVVGQTREVPRFSFLRATLGDQNPFAVLVESMRERARAGDGVRPEEGS
jgi:hypothetical protein